MPKMLCLQQKLIDSVEDEWNSESLNHGNSYVTLIALLDLTVELTTCEISDLFCNGRHVGLN